ncbi:MAG: hypothetical protein QXL16_03075, partial [Candidatus Micrarchaeaceae archaeon]
MLRNILLLAFIASSFFAYLWLSYYKQGIEWDYMSHIINARTLAGAYNPRPYFELFRAPVGETIMALFILLHISPTFPYVLFLFLFYFLSALLTAKSFKLNGPVVVSILLLQTLLYSFALNNGNEVLSLSFLMLGLFFLKKEKPIFSGISLSLAALSKYPSLLVSFPLIFLFPSKEEIYKGIVSYFIPFIPWLFFNYLISSNPIESFVLSSSLLSLNATHLPFQLVFAFFLLLFL